MKIIKNREGDTMELDGMTPDGLRKLYKNIINISRDPNPNKVMQEISKEALKVFVKQYPEYAI